MKKHGYTTEGKVRHDSIEDRRHKDKLLNPRKHPTGPERYVNPSKDEPWRAFGKKTAMLSTSERMFIHDVPRLLGDGNYANLGHSHGGSAILMAKSLQEYSLSGKVFTIDITFRYHHAMERMKTFNVTDRIEVCQGPTDEWAEKLVQEFNFVFIDADHSLEAVRTDITNWSPKIKVRGLLSLHDTNQDFSHKAIQETIAGYENWIERKDLHIHSIRTFERVR